MNYHLTLHSENRKLGGIPASISSLDSCPDICPLKKKGCYGLTGFLSWHWGRVTRGEKKGTSFKDFLGKVKALPIRTLWRYGQAGDLPGRGNRLNITQLRQLVKANLRKQGFAFSHKPLWRKAEQIAIQKANEQGFTVNLSANNMDHADYLKALGIAPVVVIVSDFQSMPQYTPLGHKLIPCPEMTHGITCNICRLCAYPDRKSIVAFAAHGSGWKYVKEIVK